MIKKIMKNEKYNLLITDKSNNSFTMQMGANGDLYWSVSGEKNYYKFVFNNNDEFFASLNSLFKQIKLTDKNKATLSNNIFNWVSEDRPSDEANKLRITQKDNEFVVEFYKNPSNFYRMCVVCFCNFGSCHQEIENIFMNFYNSFNDNYNTEELE